MNCLAEKRTLAEARRRRNEAQQREQREFDKAESDMVSLALTAYDAADPPRTTAQTKRLFDWAAVRRAVAETQFWDACCRRAEAVLANCLQALNQPAQGSSRP